MYTVPTFLQKLTLYMVTISLISLLLAGCKKENKEAKVENDIDRFWKAYDAIHTQTDTAQHMALLDSLFLSTASEGQNAMIQARNYTGKEYVNAIREYPMFWESIRTATLNYRNNEAVLESTINKIKSHYPELEPAEIFYTMGVFRSPGTGFDHRVLIAAEFALGDSSAVTKEFPEQLSHIESYYSLNPITHLDFLTAHEYVHTQQKAATHDLLAQTLFEGVADFVAHLATGKNAPFPYYKVGRANEAALITAFEKEVFNPLKQGKWMWDKNNAFQTRDLIYYMGYRIAETAYKKADNKKEAIHKMINLEYSNHEALALYVDQTQFLSTPLKTLQDNFKLIQPRLLSVKELKTDSSAISSSTTTLTIAFSEPLNPKMKSTGYGPLGKDYFPKLDSIVFSENGKTLTYFVQLEPNKQYQVLLESGFRNEKGIPISPTLIDFKTK